MNDAQRKLLAFLERHPDVRRHIANHYLTLLGVGIGLGIIAGYFLGRTS